MTHAAVAGRLTRSIEERERLLSAFLDHEQDQFARACYDMAQAFNRGGVLVPVGAGPAATDAAHLAVEFMHPVIVGKRALPALAPTNDPTGASTVAHLARAGDILVLLTHGAPSAEQTELLADAHRRGLLTIAITGADARGDADYAFAVPSSDPAIVQEVQETLYHELWELVHVFFEHPGLLDGACITCGDVAVQARVVAVREHSAFIEQTGAREEVAIDLVGEVAPGDVLLCHAGVALEKVEHDEDPTGFLYPFLERDETDLDAVLSDVRASTLRKGADVIALRHGIDLGAV